MIPQDFIARLRCPISQAPLRLIAGEELQAVAPQWPGRAPEAALATPDNAIVYPVRDGILCLLADLALTRGRPATADDSHAEAIKRDVQNFYDELGWKKDDANFSDAVIFEDLRPVAADYLHKCHLRVMQQLAPTGDYLLDVASGPVQYEEYLVYSEGYGHRVCVDISFLALIEARKRVGANGIYVLGDVTRLPFAEGVFDGVVSLHTIYHVPAPEQERAFNEIYRVLAPGRRAVVVYSWGYHSWLMLAALLPLWMWRWLARRIRRSRPGGGPRKLYSHQHGYGWFSSRRWPFAYELRSWRSVSVEFTQIFIQPWLFGRAMLRGLFRLEDRWPRLFGIVGQYPMITIVKPR